jgi:Protein of unknown function (DUF2934)
MRMASFAAGPGTFRPLSATRLTRVRRTPKRRNAVAEPKKQEIDARAYQLWEQAGRPEGREAEFWHLAEQELRNEDKASPTRTPDTL